MESRPTQGTLEPPPRGGTATRRVRRKTTRARPRGEAAAPFAAPASPFTRYQRASWWRRIRIPWTLHRYILLECVRITVVSALAVSFVCSAVVAYQTVRSGIQLAFIWPFLAKTFAYPLFFSLPMALLFGVTLTKGRMVADYEIDAVRYHGGSYLQLYFPTILLGVVAAVASYWFNGWVMPEIRYEKHNLQQYVVRQIEDLGSGANRTILLPDGGGSLTVERYEGLHLERVHIDLHRELQSRFVPDVRESLPSKLPEKITLLALEGRIEIAPDCSGLTLHLRSVDILVPEPIKSSRTGNDQFIQHFSISDQVSIPLSFEKRQRSVKVLVTPMLSSTIVDLEHELELRPDRPATERRLRRCRAEWHRRLAYAVSAFTFPFFGIALCLLLDLRSRLVPFFLGSAGVLVAFYPMLMVGGYLAENGIFPAVSYALPNLALLALGIFLTRKVLRR